MIEFKNVKKEYVDNQNEKIVALHDINFSLDSTGLVFISGHSGSGKSTLINIIAGLDECDFGEVTNDYETPNFYSMVFQDFQLINYLTVKDNILLAGNIQNDISNFDVLVEKYDLKEILNHYPNEISGGQKQRVAIVRALLMNRPVILCDEPTGNLDEENSALIANALKEEAKNKLVVVVSHDTEIFAPVADRIITLKKGRIKSDVVINKSDSKIFNKEHDVKLTLKNNLFLLTRFFKKNKFKHILLFVSLLLSMLLLISSFNGLFQKNYDIIYRAHKNADFVSLDMKKYTKYNTFNSRNFTLDERKNYLSEYDAYLFYDQQTSIEEVKISRVYIGSDIKRDIIAGTNILEYNDIAISDYVASKFSDDYNDLIGTIKDEYKIAAIYKTGYNKGMDIGDKYKQYETAYMIYETYDYHILTGKKTKYVVDFTTIDSDSYGPMTIYNINYYNDVESTGLELNKGEMYINNYIAKELSIDPATCEGKKISFKIMNNYNYYDTTCEKYTYEFTIKGIFPGRFSRLEVALSDEDFAEMSFHSNYNTYNTSMGFSFNSYSKNDIKNLINDRFFCDSALSYDIEMGTDWISDMGYVLMAISGVIFFVTIFIIINFIHIIFEREKRTQGVLTSFGVKKSRVIRMYYYDILISTLIPFVIVILLEPVIILLLNFYIKKVGISSVSCLYYSGMSILCLLLIFAVVLALIYAILILKIKRKNIIDIIYER